MASANRSGNQRRLAAACDPKTFIIPELEPAGVNATPLYKKILKNSQYPPIMNERSWTLASPYKEVFSLGYRTPSDSIGNNYTPAAQDLRLSHIKRIHVPRKDVDEEDDQVGGKKKKWISATMKKYIDPYQKAPSRPRTPNEQLEIIKAVEKKMHLGSVSKDDDLERYYYYIDNGIRQDMLAPFNAESFRNIHCLITDELIKQGSYTPLLGISRIQELHEEILDDYFYSLRKGIVDYILKDPKKKKVPTATLR